MKIDVLIEEKYLSKEDIKTDINILKGNIHKFLIDHIDFVDDVVLNYLEVNENNLLGDFTFMFKMKRLSEIELEIEYLKKYKNTFILLQDYFSVVESFFCDVVAEPESIIDKTEFLLKCLNKLFGDNSYSVTTIFDFNNIKYRENEPLEIAQDLARRKYVTIASKDNIKISIKGASYVERKMKQGKKVKRNEELNTKIDSVISHLKKLGYGQEIIFDEIEELRELDGKLSKKSWGQLLKSKLFDLAVDQVIDKEVARKVFDYLTNHGLKFLQ